MTIDLAQFQGALNAEQKEFFDNQLKQTRETAVTEFKTTSEAERKKLIPEKYEIKFADKTALDPQTDAEKIVAYAKARGFSNSEAQDLVKEIEGVAGGITTRQQAFLQSEAKRWETEVKADKDLGGTNYDNTVKNINRVMEKFAPGENNPLRTILNSTGYGNHPEWVRFINAIGKAMAEDGPLGGKGGGSGDKKSAADVLFPELAAKN